MCWLLYHFQTAFILQTCRMYNPGLFSHRKNEILYHKWTKLEDIMLNEITYTETQKQANKKALAGAQNTI